MQRERAVDDQVSTMEQRAPPQPTTKDHVEERGGTGADAGRPGGTASQAPPLVVAGRYAVDLKKPEPAFARAGGQAYSAQDLKDPGRRVYALVQRKAVPQRSDIYRALLGDPVSNLLNPLAQGVYRLGPQGPARLVTIVEAPAGPSLGGALKGHPISPQILRKLVVPAAVRMLGGLHARKLTHRAIFPENLFFANTEGGEIVFGECFSGPPGIDLAPCYEPIERAMADPTGRGPAGPEADLFALGATLLALYLGRPLGGRRDPDSLLRARIAQGSFWALSGGEEIPGLLGMLLRGLLNDDPEERWTLADVEAWTENAARPRRVLNLSWTFARPVSFMRQSFSDRRVLAQELARHPLEAARWLRGIDFNLWMQTYLTAETLSEKIEKHLNLHADPDLSATHHGDHALVCRFCALLDPFGPLRWRSRQIMPDAVGPALVGAFAERDEQAIEDMRHFFDQGVMPAAVEIMGERNGAVQKIAFDLAQLAQLVRSSDPDKGLERALYELNPALPCLSPAFQGMWVGSTEGLMEALDRMCEKAGDLFKLMDAHVLAFIAARERAAARMAAAVRATPKDQRRTLAAIIALLAFLQEKAQIEKLPHLTRRLGDMLRPELSRLKGRQRREKALELLKSVAEGGSVPKLAKIFDLVAISRADAEGFRQARWRYRRLEQRRQHLSRKVMPSDPEARALGYRAASVIAVIAVMLTAVVVFLGP
ncbi:MAG: hypothetical protein KatS3mg119_2059 [Rhodothalassiaceae bacterium]|nr:MAG: hypothetical protein KatS3mg119_2059 [Rhodothalassiaceae bacterium]